MPRFSAGEGATILQRLEWTFLYKVYVDKVYARQDDGMYCRLRQPWEALTDDQLAGVCMICLRVAPMEDFDPLTWRTDDRKSDINNWMCCEGEYANDRDRSFEGFTLSALLKKRIKLTRHTKIMGHVAQLFTQLKRVLQVYGRYVDTKSSRAKKEVFKYLAPPVFRDWATNYIFQVGGPEHISYKAMSFTDMRKLIEDRARQYDEMPGNEPKFATFCGLCAKDKRPTWVCMGHNSGQCPHSKGGGNSKRRKAPRRVRQVNSKTKVSSTWDLRGKSNVGAARKGCKACKNSGDKWRMKKAHTHTDAECGYAKQRKGLGNHGNYIEPQFHKRKPGAKPKPGNKKPRRVRRVGGEGNHQSDPKKKLPCHKVLQGQQCDGASCPYNHALARKLRSEGCKLKDGKVIDKHNKPYRVKNINLKVNRSKTRNERDVEAEDYIWIEIDSQRRQVFPDGGSPDISIISKVEADGFAAIEGGSFRWIDGTVDLSGYVGSVHTKGAPLCELMITARLKTGTCSFREKFAVVDGYEGILLGRTALNAMGIESSVDQYNRLVVDGLTERMAQAATVKAVMCAISARVCRLRSTPAEQVEAPPDEDFLPPAQEWAEDAEDNAAAFNELAAMDHNNFIEPEHLSEYHNTMRAFGWTPIDLASGYWQVDLSHDYEEQAQSAHVRELRAAANAVPEDPDCPRLSWEQLVNGAEPRRHPATIASYAKHKAKLEAEGRTTLQALQAKLDLETHVPMGMALIDNTWPYHVDARHRILFFGDTFDAWVHTDHMAARVCWDRPGEEALQCFKAICEKMLRLLNVKDAFCFVNPKGRRSIPSIPHCHVFTRWDSDDSEEAHLPEWSDDDSDDENSDDEDSDDEDSNGEDEEEVFMVRKADGTYRYCVDMVTTTADALLHDADGYQDPYAALHSSWPVAHHKATVASVVAEAGDPNREWGHRQPAPTREQLMEHAVQPQGVVYVGSQNWRNMDETKAYSEPLLRQTLITTAAANRAALELPKSGPTPRPTFGVDEWAMSAMDIKELKLAGETTATLQVRLENESPACVVDCKMLVVNSDIPCVILAQDVLNQMLGQMGISDMMPETEPDERQKVEAYLNFCLYDMHTQGVPEVIIDAMEHALLHTKLNKVFRLTLAKGHSADVPPMESELREGATPPPTPNRPYSRDKMEYLKKEIQKMQDMGLMSPADTPWVACIHLVRKPDGSYRLCLDDREMNKRRKPIEYPVGDRRVLETYWLNAIWYGSTDLTKGYWQVGIATKSRDYHGVWTPIGVFRFNRLVMGDHSACQYFTKQIRAALKDIENREPAGLVVYVDDQGHYAQCDKHLLGASQEEKELNAAWNMLWHYIGNKSKGIKGFFETCYEKKLFLSPKKLQLMRRSIKFLGDLVSADGISIHPDRVQAVRDMPLPTTAKDVYQWVAFMAWSEDKIPGLARLTQPLRDIVNNAFELRKTKSRKASAIANVSVKAAGWTDETTKQWEELKTAFVNGVTRSIYDESLVTCLHTDASNFHYDGILTQCEPSELSKPIGEQKHTVLAVYSGSFKGSEVNWHTAEKELYPIVVGLKKFRYLMHGQHTVVLHTDHRNLLYLHNASLKPGVVNVSVQRKLSRWFLFISSFNVEWRHVPGEDHHGADYFSRGAVRLNRAPRPDQAQVAKIFTTWAAPPRATPKPTAKRVSVVVLQPDELRDTVQQVQELSHDVKDILATTAPWPSQAWFLAVQAGMRDEVKAQLDLRPNGLYYTKPQQQRDVLKELFKLTPLQDLNGVELYCGGGGSGQGIHDAGGFNLAAFDTNGNARKVYEKNFPRTDARDVNCMDVADLAAWLESYFNSWEKARYLWMSPKCAWSLAQDQSKPDPAKQSYAVFVEALTQLHDDNPDALPDVVFGENVTGLEDSKDGVWDDFLKGMSRLGYEPHYARISTKHVGLPQKRLRLVHAMVRRGQGITCSLERIADLLRQQEPITLGQMFPGEKVFFYDHRFGGRHLYGPDELLYALRQRCMWRPSSYDENVEEKALGYKFTDSMVWTLDSLKKVQGFPDTYDLSAVDDVEAARLIGLSVSPLVARVVASSCDWDGSKRVQRLVSSLELANDLNAGEPHLFIPRGMGQCKYKADAERAEELITALVAVAHQGPAGHRSKAVAMKALKELFVFRDLEATVERIIGGCLQCIKGAPGTSVARPLGQTLLGQKPCEVITCDFFSMGKGHGYQLSVKDTFSGYCQLTWHPSPSAYEAMLGLQQWCSAYKVPIFLLSDGGSHFVNAVIKKLCKTLRIRHHVHTADMHFNAGTIEILQRACKQFYRRICSETKTPTSQAKQFMPMLQRALNHQKSQTHNVSPLEAFTGQKPDTPLRAAATFGGPEFKTITVANVSAATMKLVAKEVAAVREALAGLHRRVAVTKRQARARSRAAANKKNKKLFNQDFSIGDFVWVARPKGAPTDKLAFEWQGPFEVVRPYLTDAAVLSSPADGIDVSTHIYEVRLVGRKEIIRAHCSRMKLYLKADQTPPAEVIEVAHHDLGQQLLPNYMSEYYTDNGKLEMLVYWIGFAEPSREEWRALDNNNFVYDSLIMHEGEHSLVDEALSSIRMEREVANEMKKAAALQKQAAHK